MILFNLILVVYFTLSECSLNCNLLNEFSMPELTIGSQSEPTLNTTSRNGSSVTPLSFWEFDPMFGKCGIVPAELINNKKSNAKYFMHWLFNSHSSFKVSFRLEYVENYTYLGYYFSIRKFTTNDDVLTKLRRLDDQNSTSSTEQEESLEESLEFNGSLNDKRNLVRASGGRVDANSTTNTTNPITYNNLIVKFRTSSLESNYEMVSQMYVICAVLVNLKSGITFTLPFMCMDVFVDREFYKSIVLSNNTLTVLREHSYGVLISIGPLTVVVFFILASMHYVITKRKSDSDSLLIDSEDLLAIRSNQGRIVRFSQGVEHLNSTSESEDADDRSMLEAPVAHEYQESKEPVPSQAEIVSQDLIHDSWSSAQFDLSSI